MGCASQKQPWIPNHELPENLPPGYATWLLSVRALPPTAVHAPCRRCSGGAMVAKWRLQTSRASGPRSHCAQVNEERTNAVLTASSALWIARVFLVISIAKRLRLPIISTAGGASMYRFISPRWRFLHLNARPKAARLVCGGAVIFLVWLPPTLFAVCSPSY